MLTDAEAFLVEEPVPLGPRGAYQPRYSGYMPFARVFDCVWGGRRHVMIGPIQIDRFGQTNLSGIGALARPKVQMLGMRGLPGNGISHPSLDVRDHSFPRGRPGQGDIVGGGVTTRRAGGGRQRLTSTCASS
jgi:glutaconate CoA-transferase subunit B